MIRECCYAVEGLTGRAAGLADEYDAAQDRGEVAAAGGDRSKIPDGNFATAAEIGLTHKDIHDARQIRDAEQAGPGVIRRTLDRLPDAGEEPTRAAIGGGPQDYKGAGLVWVW